MAVRRDPLEKRYYKIREVASMLDETTATLRFWESEFARWLKPRRNAGGTRHYTPADLETLRTIRYLLRDKGLRIEAARRQMALNRQVIDRRREAVERLQAMRLTIEGLLSALDARLHPSR